METGGVHDENDYEVTSAKNRKRKLVKHTPSSKNT